MGILVIVLLAICIIMVLNMGAKQDIKEEKEIQNLFQHSININEQNTGENTMTEEEYREKSLQQMQSMNINLVQLQSQIEKQNKEINEIKSNVGCITFILVAPIVIGLILLFLSVIADYNILKNLSDTFNSIPQATVYVTDDEGNIIENAEYHGQNVAVPE